MNKLKLAKQGGLLKRQKVWVEYANGHKLKVLQSDCDLEKNRHENQRLKPRDKCWTVGNSDTHIGIHTH